MQRLLEKYCPQVKVVGVADGVETALTVIRDLRPDLVFLDIEMIQGNAFDLLNRLYPIDFHVIFVTAFDNYAIRVFKYNAVDYLLKPVNIRELCVAVEKFSGKFTEGKVLERVKEMLENLQEGNGAEKKIALPTAEGFYLVFLRNIVRLEARNAFIIVYLQDKSSVKATGSIKDYEDLLPDAGFFRIHHSHIINLNKIEAYQKGRGGYVTMEDGSSIEVASRRREAFMKRLLK